MATTKTKKAATPIDVRETFVSLQKDFAESGISVAEKLKVLYALQQADNEIDKIRNLRGALPQEVAQIEDELAGFQSKIAHHEEMISGFEEKKGLEIQNLRLQAREDEARRVQSLLDAHKKEMDARKQEVAELEKEVEVYKNFKARRSVKLLGEDLEQHCYALYTQMLLPVMPGATFEKDNTVVRDDDEGRGTKGDFIFRDSEDGTEYISIMFEMKNEGDASSVRHKNSDFFDKLDKDRRKKGCEFAVLVSMLEMDNDLYNNGIVAVPGYDKMYVVRPDNFIPIITLLVQTSKKALGYKKELAVARSQSMDLTNFEDQLTAFKDAFGKNVVNAKKKYDEAIEGIDKSIKTMEAIKKALQVSAGHLDAAGNKVEGLSVKKLTKGNPTVSSMLAEARAKKAEAEALLQPEEQ